ncbi:MAG: ATP-binding protein [Bacilli bacterium]|nr:ATP-binding protein [Bacilli bacterium]
MNKQLTLFDSNSDFYESGVSKLDEQTAVFRVHASLIYKLGESLIADEVTALSELIKNAYDADAKFCALTIDTNYTETIDDTIFKGKIELSDNGCGMDLQTIVDGWLTLSNSPKKKMKKDRKTTPKYHRYPLGDKGLGRLSVQKLGRHMQMITKAVSSSIEYTVTIPWGDFLKNTTIDQIPIIINERVVDNEKSYTKIVIKDLINSELWDSQDQINILSNSINKIVSPFRSRENNFKVIATVNGQSIDTIDAVFEELLLRARAKHVISYSNGKSELRSYYTSSFFYNRDMMDKILDDKFSVNGSSLSDFWNGHKCNLSRFSFNLEERNVFTLEDECIFEDIVYNEDETKSSDPGAFECEIYEYTLDKIFLDNFYQIISFSELINQNEYKDFIERFHGIKVVRDGFIVQGYGEGDGGDWLGLSSSSKTKGSFFDLRNDSVIGCVYLTGIENSVLKETTNREGFVEDNYFSAFKNILTDSIRRINKNRKKLNDEMRDYLNQTIATTADVDGNGLSFQPVIETIKNRLTQTFETTSKNANVLKDTMESCDAIREEMGSALFVPAETVSKFENLYRNIQNLSNDYLALLESQRYLAQQIETVSFDFEKMNERLQDLFELAGLGLSVEMFSHEFDAAIRGIRLKNNSLISNAEAKSKDACIKHIHYIDYALDTLRKQMSYFNPGLKFVRSEKQTFSFKEFIEEHRSFYLERCKNNGIEYALSINDDFNITVNRGMLNQVFDNLFNNSEYWLNYSQEKKLIKEKIFSIQSPEKGIVIVSDNGIGISRDIETRLFDPFESKKKKGRGLGLYIVANNLKYHSARIRLLGERNIHGNLYKFEINLSTTIS